MKIRLLMIFVLLLLAPMVFGQVFICNPDKTKLIIFTADTPYCNIYTNRNDMNNILSENEVAFIEENVLDEIEIPCGKGEEHGFIFPGTLWCGKGTKAACYADLGEYREEDECCREHDNCPNYLAAGECRNGVCNDSAYTRSHCDCDYKFKNCLRNVGTSPANLIGMIFFNIVKVNCFRKVNCNAATVDMPLLRANEPDLSSANLLREDDDCEYEFESTQKYRADQTNARNGRKLNFFERFFVKINLLRK